MTTSRIVFAFSKDFSMKEILIIITSFILSLAFFDVYADSVEELYDDGCIKMKQGDFPAALQRFREVVDSSEVNPTKAQEELYASSLNKIAMISIMRSNYVTAYSSLLKALDYASPFQEPLTHLYLAIISNYYRDFRAEEQHLKDALGNIDKVTGDDMKTLVFINFAGFYNEHNRLGEIESEIRDFLSQFTLDGSAFKQYATLTVKAYLSNIEGNPDEALGLLKMAAAVVEKDSDEQNAYLSAMFDIALQYMHQGDYTNAISQLQECLSLAKKNNFTVFIPMAYEYLSKCYGIAGDRDNEMLFRQESVNLRDSILSLSTFGQIKDMQADFKAEQHRKDMATVTLKSHYYRLFLLLAGLMIMFGVIFTLILIRKNKSLKTAYIALYERNQQIETQEKRLEAKEAVAPVSESVPEARIALHQPLREAFDNGTLWLQPDFTLAMLANELNTNTTYLSTAVNEVYGKSFRSLVNEKRIRRASEMLSQDEKYGHLTIEAIASSCGFKTASHFSSVFKSVIGMSPATYREIDKLKKSTS